MVRGRRDRFHCAARLVAFDRQQSHCRIVFGVRLVNPDEVPTERPRVGAPHHCPSADQDPSHFLTWAEVKEPRGHVSTPGALDRNFHPVETSPREHARQKRYDPAKDGHFSIPPDRGVLGREGCRNPTSVLGSGTYAHQAGEPWSGITAPFPPLTE